jgi:hypothetical protein
MPSAAPFLLLLEVSNLAVYPVDQQAASSPLALYTATTQSAFICQMRPTFATPFRKASSAAAPIGNTGFSIRPARAISPLSLTIIYTLLTSGDNPTAPLHPVSGLNQNS